LINTGLCIFITITNSNYNANSIVAGTKNIEESLHYASSIKQANRHFITWSHALIQM